MLFVPVLRHYLSWGTGTFLFCQFRVMSVAAEQKDLYRYSYSTSSKFFAVIVILTCSQRVSLNTLYAVLLILTREQPFSPISALPLKRLIFAE